MINPDLRTDSLLPNRLNHDNTETMLMRPASQYLEMGCVFQDALYRSQ